MYCDQHFCFIPGLKKSLKRSPNPPPGPDWNFPTHSKTVPSCTIHGYFETPQTWDDPWNEGKELLISQGHLGSAGGAGGATSASSEWGCCNLAVPFPAFPEFPAFPAPWNVKGKRGACPWVGGTASAQQRHTSQQGCHTPIPTPPKTLGIFLSWILAGLGILVPCGGG